ncbi:MAG: hypothetical protein ACREM6_10725 [Vulcanimicrobiaceae bacterium]
MHRSITIGGVADFPFSSVVEYTERFVRDELAPKDGMSIELRVPVGARAIGATRRFHVATSVVRDLTDLTRRHGAVWIHFSADGQAPALPDFRALLTARPWHGKTRLKLLGDFESPGGAIGRAVDLLVGRLVVRRILHAFFDELVASLERQNRAFHHLAGKR